MGKTVDDLQANRARRAQLERKRYTASRAKAQDRLKSRQGLTLEEKAEMLAAQNDRCKCCGDLLPDISKAHVDHCHTWLTIRALLCGSCKIGLGSFKDDPERLRKAIRYLEDHPGIGTRSVEKWTSSKSA